VSRYAAKQMEIIPRAIKTKPAITESRITKAIHRRALHYLDMANDLILQKVRLELIQQLREQVLSSLCLADANRIGSHLALPADQSL
jgi:hypothetical protein